MWALLVLTAATTASAPGRTDVDADVKLCRDYVAKHANQTWRSPAGALTYPYLVPVREMHTDEPPT